MQIIKLPHSHKYVNTNIYVINTKHGIEAIDKDYLYPIEEKKLDVIIDDYVQDDYTILINSLMKRIGY